MGLTTASDLPQSIRAAVAAHGSEFLPAYLEQNPGKWHKVPVREPGGGAGPP